MSKALMLFGRAPSTATGISSEPYEVTLLKKGLRYQSDSGTVSAVEYEWVYSTIVVATAPGLAVYETLYEYFVWRLAKRWQVRERSLSRRGLTLVDLFAKDLAESAMRRAGTESQMIHAIIRPWEPACLTLHFCP